MDQNDRDYAQSFIADMMPLDDFNSARTMAEFIATMSKGLDPVDIDHNTLMQYFNRAMTVEEAQSTFDRLIVHLTRGKKTDKVRIVFK